jgi:hypothetical protein
MSDAAPHTWIEAERVSGRRLDRRLTYTIIDAVVYQDIRYSAPCSGCTEVAECTSGPDRGSGCEECGYTGRERRCEGAPVDLCQPGDAAPPAAEPAPAFTADRPEAPGEAL